MVRPFPRLPIHPGPQPADVADARRVGSKGTENFAGGGDHPPPPGTTVNEPGVSA